MRFLLYSSTEVPHASSHGIAAALERLGHGVSRWQRRPEFTPEPLIQTIREYRIDCVCLFGGAEISASSLELMKQQCPKTLFVMWNFDVMTMPDTLKWFEPLARRADLCIQMDGSDWPIGIDRLWCPMGFDPSVEKPWLGDITLEEHARYDADVAFLGMPYGFGGRRELLDRVSRWCHERGRTFKIWGMWTEYLIGDELAKMIACTKVHLGHEPDDRPHVGHWSQRVYSVLGCRGFYLANQVDGYAQQFIDGDVLKFWKTEEQLFELLDIYLGSDTMRTVTASRGYRYAVDHCSWDARIKQYVLPELVRRLKVKCERA